MPAGQRAPADDPDHDGLPNLLEFAFGQHPQNAASRELPAWVEQEGAWRVDFISPEGAADLAYTAEWSLTLSDDPDSWTPLPNLAVAPHYRFELPADPARPQAFVRLRVVLP